MSDQDHDEDELAPIDYSGPYVMPATGLAVPEGIVPRHPETRAIILRAMDEWWAGLSPEQRAGLWTRYGS